MSCPLCLGRAVGARDCITVLSSIIFKVPGLVLTLVSGKGGRARAQSFALDVLAVAIFVAFLKELPRRWETSSDEDKS